MPDFCAAYGCSNERSLQTRNRGITFHKFPKSRERRRQWELALRRDGFVVNDRSLLCSEHFRNEDFDMTGQTVRLRAGTVPQIFKVPAHYQRMVAKRSTTASRRADENLPMDLHQDQPPPDVPQAAAGERQKSQKTKATDHLYALPSCPKALTAKLDATLKTVRKLQRDKLNVQRMMRAVCVDAPGGPENLLLKSVSRPQPKDGEVLIKVYATALNRADLLQRQGLYPPPPGESDIIGLEVAGIVEALGPGLKGGWKTGERVMALLSGGGYAEYVVVPEGLVMAAPPALTLCQAAAIPEAWLTAFQLLVLIAEVKEGEVVLIHAGASGVGTAAVQLVRLFGAVPVVTAGSPEKLKLAETLGAVARFNYKEQSFAQGVKDFTGGKGADVILDCIGGSNWEQNVDCLATDGRWVLYGLMGGRRVEGDLLGRLLFKRGRLLCSLLRSRSLQYKADLVQAFTQRALPCFSEQQPASLKPVIDSTFSLEDIAEAHRHMEANRNMGKIVISVIPECQENK